MNSNTMKTAILSFALTAGFATGALADEKLAYKKLYDCLVTDGAGYIITDYTPHCRRTILEAKIEFLNSSDGKALFCANGYTGNLGNWGNIFYGHFDKDFSYQNCWFEMCPRGDVLPDGKAHVMRYSFNTMSYDGTLYSEDDGGEILNERASGPLYLFASMCPTLSEKLTARVHYVKIWEVDADNASVTNLVHEYVPALSTENVKTLYDTKTNKCLTPTNGRGFLLTPVDNIMSWSGAGADSNFSNPENWTNGIAPCAGDAYLFANDDASAGNRRVHFDLPSSETAPLIQDFHCSGDYTFSSDSPVWATLAGLKEGFYPAISRSRTEITGPNTEMHFFPIGSTYTYCVVSAGATLQVTDGAKAYVENLTWANKNYPTLVVSNANSLLSFNIHSTSSGDYPTFAAYDGGKMTCTKIDKALSSQGVLAPTFIADGANSVLDMSKVKIQSGMITIKSTDGGTVKLGQIANTTSAGSITCDDGKISFSGTVTYPNADLKPTLTLAGANPTITITDTAKLGRDGTGYWLNLKLKPELSWKGAPRIKETGSKKTLTFYKGIKYDVDVTAFTNYYGNFIMPLAQSTSSTYLAYTAPSEGWITCSGEGADNCSATVSKSGAMLEFSVAAANAPEGKVAAVNVGSAASVFYDTLEDAVAAAPDGADVVLTQDVAVGKLQAAGKTIKIYAVKPVTLTVVGKLGEGITIGDNVTLVEKSGMIIIIK